MSSIPHQPGQPPSDPKSDSTFDSKFDTIEMLAPVHPEGDSWDRFELDEAIMVLSNFDLGKVWAVREFHRGSRRSPKLLIKCDRGLLMLKRLAPGRSDPAHVSMGHRIQQRLAAAGFPLPRLAPLRDGTGTMVVHDARVYELFEVQRGQPYDHSPAQAFEAGKALAQFHSIVAPERIETADPAVSYHRHPVVQSLLAAFVTKYPDVATDVLASIYQLAGERADRAGLPQWPAQLVHGDWHPGNLLFSSGRVTSVFDYDTLRMLPRATDLAMGALQFSVRRSEGDPASWPDGPDEPCLRTFVQGYDQGSTSLVSRAELEALPWLMIEALIAEPVLQIGAKGAFGRLKAEAALAMVERKAHWIRVNHEKVTRLAS